MAVVSSLVVAEVVVLEAGLSPPPHAANRSVATLSVASNLEFTIKYSFWMSTAQV